MNSGDLNENFEAWGKFEFEYINDGRVIDCEKFNGDNNWRREYNDLLSQFPATFFNLFFFSFLSFICFFFIIIVVSLRYGGLISIIRFSFRLFRFVYLFFISFCRVNDRGSFSFYNFCKRVARLKKKIEL